MERQSQSNQNDNERAMKFCSNVNQSDTQRADTFQWMREYNGCPICQSTEYDGKEICPTHVDKV